MTNYPLPLSHSVPWHRVNVGCGPAEERVLLTGLHAVADIYCENCKTTLGWKYVSMRSLVGGERVLKGIAESLILEEGFLFLLPVTLWDCLRPGQETEPQEQFLTHSCLPHSFFPSH